MSNRSFELLPQATTSRVSRGRSTRSIYRAASGLFAATLAMYVGARWLDVHSTVLYEGAQQSGAPVVAIEQELTQLANEQSDIQAKLDVQRKIGVPIPASGVVQAIASSLPRGALLERIGLEYANVQGTNRKVRRSGKENDAPRELRGEISGIAADESDVGAIVDALGGLAPVSKVSLESSRSREFLGRNAREFRVTFTVDLDRRWKLPVIAGASTDEQAGGTK
jgi:hypothetical protein